MSDLGDDFKAMRELSQEKRERNRAASTAILRRVGIPFESKNDGAHLIVLYAIDFWPGTGLWIVRKTKKKGRGVRNLLAIIRKGI